MMSGGTTFRPEICDFFAQNRMFSSKLCFRKKAQKRQFFHGRENCQRFPGGMWFRRTSGEPLE